MAHLARVKGGDMELSALTDKYDPSGLEESGGRVGEDVAWKGHRRAWANHNQAQQAEGLAWATVLAWVVQQGAISVLYLRFGDETGCVLRT